MKTNYLIQEEDPTIYRYSKDQFKGEEMELLKPGFYYADSVGGGLFSPEVLTYKPIEMKDGLVKFKSGVIGNVLQNTEEFFSAETTRKYKQLEIQQKMGILLYGPAGTGKTCTAYLIIQELISRYNAIALDVTRKSVRFIKKTVASIRALQGNPIVLFYDEMEEAFNAEETEWLTFLDGTDSINNCIILGCTNFIHQVPTRIKERPSRIKYSYYIKSLPISVYEEYLSSKLPELESAIQAEITFLAEDAGLTIDQFKHAVIDFYINGVSPKDAVKMIAETKFHEE